MSKTFRLFVIFWLVLSLLASPGAAGAQAGDNRFFSETGHNLSGEFLKYYQGIPGADVIFGYPITEAFTDANSGRLIQYFTRARFEYYPENAEGQRVKLSSLGEYLYVPGPAINVFTPFGCRSFSNGKYVCYAFLEFFEKNGGEAVFGLPVSGFEILNGRIVQHFQRARFDWYPEYPEGQKVALADLGRIYFDFVKEDPARLSPVASNEAAQVISLQARAFMWKAVTQPDDFQTVYVVVQDQTLSPVKNAFAVVTIYWANGTPQSITLPTNEYGVVIVPFQVTGQPYGSLILVTVQVLYQDLEASTVTSFRIWY